MSSARNIRLGLATGVWLLATTAFAIPAERGIQLQLQVPEEPLATGEKGRLVVALTDPQGETRKSQRELTLTLDTSPGLLKERRVSWPKGQSRLEIEIVSEVPGSWFVEASGEGLFPASGLVVVVASEDAPRSVQAEPARGAPDGVPRSVAAEPVRAEPVAAAPERNGEEAMEVSEGSPVDDLLFPMPEAIGVEVSAQGIDVVALDQRRWSPQLLRQARLQNSALLESLETRGPAPSPQEGALVLQPSQANVRRGADGWYRLKVKALWFVDGLPKKIDDALDIWFVFAPHTPDRGTEPETVSILRGAVGVDTEIRSQSPGTVQLSAMSERGISEPIEVSFLAPRPTELSFSQAHYRVQSLAGTSLDLSIQLRDEINNAVVATEDSEVVLSWSGEDGTGRQNLMIAEGSFEVAAPLEVSRFGSYVVEASMVDLLPARAEVELDPDYLALLFALLGGILGALARLLFVHKDGKWKKGILRSLVLGAIAALLVLLLAVFQVLSTLEQWLPSELSMLGKLPFANHMAILLLGLVAGLGLESIILRFVGRKSVSTDEPPADEPPADEPPGNEPPGNEPPANEEVAANPAG